MSNQQKPIRKYEKRKAPFKTGTKEYRNWLYLNFYRDQKPWLGAYQRKKERERLKKVNSIETQI